MSRLAEAMAAAEQGVEVPTDFWSGTTFDGSQSFRVHSHAPDLIYYPGGFEDCATCAPQFLAGRIRDQENRIRVAIDDLVEFLNVMGAD